MRRLLTRVSAVLGITLAAAFVLVYGVRPADVDEFRKVRATALVSLPDGGQVYRTLAVPVPVLKDGGLGQLPDEEFIACALSARLSGNASSFDACVDGGTPAVGVVWLGHHLGAEACDEDVCDGGAGVRVEADACACSGGSACEESAGDGGWVQARRGLTLSSGMWRGAGCVPKVCVELLGVTSWPEQCPL